MVYSNKINEYKYILFDLDGTVIDSKPGILRCIKHALDNHAVPCPDEILDKMVGPPFRTSMNELLGVHDEELICVLIEEYRGEYNDSGLQTSVVYDGVESLLSRLKNDGYVLAIATSKPYMFSKKIIDMLGLDEYFDFIGAASSDSSMESKSDVINHVLDSLGVQDKSEVLMIGDRLYDIVGAKKSGLDVLAVLWGYGNEKEFLDYGADYIMRVPDEVYEFLKK